MEGNLYTFSAIKGIQAGLPYYVVMIPLNLIPRIFVFDESTVPADMRSQRVLSKQRIPQIAKYITENLEEYTFSSLCASVDASLTFQGGDTKSGLANVGKLSFPMSAQILLNDGQHRRAAIEEALKEKPELGIETIAVVIFQDKGLQKSQQMFVDLNKNAIKPSGSLNVLFDHRDPASRISNRLLEEVPFFDRFIEREKTTLSNRTSKLYTLSALNSANKNMLKGHLEDEESSMLIAKEFWSQAVEQLPEWKRLSVDSARSSELRQETILAHGVTLKALGRVAFRLLELEPPNSDFRRHLTEIGKVDWSKRNSELWSGRALNSGRINGSKKSERLIENQILSQIGIPLSNDGETLEQEFTEAKDE